MYPDNVRDRIAIVLAVALLAVAAVGPPAAAQADAEPAFVVELHADGSATVSVRSTFDLTTDADREAFRTLMDDEQAQADATARFRDRMRTVAAEAENATGREMQVTGATIDLRRTADDGTGIVTLSARWAGLAAVEGETLVVTEPFASGFAPDWPFVLRAPDGYAFASAAPQPADRTDGAVSWAAGAELDGFEVALTPDPTASGSAADGGARTGGQPGFGATAALLAVLAAATVARLRAG